MSLQRRLLDGLLTDEHRARPVHCRKPARSLAQLVRIIMKVLDLEVPLEEWLPRHASLAH